MGAGSSVRDRNTGEGFPSRRRGRFAGATTHPSLLPPIEATALNGAAEAPDRAGANLADPECLSPAE